MPKLEIRLFGPFQAALDGTPIAGFESNKVRALLAYLATESARPQPRERLAGLLWPGWPQKSAMSNLRYALADLRKNLRDREADPPFLLISREAIQFNRDSEARVNIVEFERLSDLSDQGSVSIDQHPAISSSPDRVRAQSTIKNLQSAIELYRGEFLEGFSLSDSPPFEEWILAKRAYFKQQVMKVLYTLVEGYEARGQWEPALAYARRQIELEPWQEEAHRQVMRLLAQSGQRSAALAQYETCRRLLAKELGVQPAVVILMTPENSVRKAWLRAEA
jgi:DNA-binding SARP family transcriptional activator